MSDVAVYMQMSPLAKSSFERGLRGGRTGNIFARAEYRLVSPIATRTMRGSDPKRLAPYQGQALIKAFDVEWDI